MTLRWTSLIAVALSTASLAAGGQARTIAQKYDEYNEAVQAAIMASPANYRLAGVDYTTLFSADQTSAAIHEAATDDLRLLFDAATEAAFYTRLVGDAAHFTEDMARDLAELDKRHSATTDEHTEMYKALALNGEFSAARAFYRKHKIADLPPLPTVRDEVPHDRSGGPTMLTLSAKRRALIRRFVDIGNGPMVIALVDPQCHFCEAFLRDMQTHPELLGKFENHSIWITPTDGIFQFDTLQQWNHNHPRQPLNIVYRFSEWSMIQDVAVPTFYFLRNGKLVAIVVGWPKEGNVPELRVALKKIGLSADGPTR